MKQCPLTVLVCTEHGAPRPVIPLAIADDNATTTVVMGLQPLTHATSRLSHLANCAVAAAAANGNHSNPEQCQCVRKTQTILHGILTGQGYKYGYGDLLRQSGYHDNDVATAPICLRLDLVTNGNHGDLPPPLVRSPEATTPSRCTTPVVDK